MVGRLSALIGQVQESGIRVNTSLNELAATARQQQATASEIAATTSEVSATSKQISATSHELVRTMQEVSTVTEQSATLAESGQVGVTQMEATMRHVMEAAGAISAKLTVLSEKAGHITQVVTTITRWPTRRTCCRSMQAIEAEKAGRWREVCGGGDRDSAARRSNCSGTYDIERDRRIRSVGGVAGMGWTSSRRKCAAACDVQEVGGQLSQIIQQVQALARRWNL